MLPANAANENLRALLMRLRAGQLLRSRGRARDFGLTWQDECSREAHQQMYRYFNDGIDPPAGWFQNDTPSRRPR